MDTSTQFLRELQEQLYYYKQRACKAEKELLDFKKNQFLASLEKHLKDLEDDTSNKIHLYSFNQERTEQLRMEFMQKTKQTETTRQRALEIFRFNLGAIEKGYEPESLPSIDSNIDLSTYQLPRHPGNSRFYPQFNNTSFSSSLTSSAVGLPPIGMMNRNQSTALALDELLTPGGPTTHGGVHFNTQPDMKRDLNHLNTEPSSHLNSSLLHQHPLPPTNHPPPSPGMMRLINNHQPDAHMSGQANLNDVNSVPGLADVLSEPIFNESLQQQSPQPQTSHNYSLNPANNIDGSTLSLDSMSLSDSTPDSQSSGAPGAAKWSQIAATGVGSLPADAWQSVNKKTRNNSAGKQTKPVALNELNDGDRFEKMCELLQEKYQLTRQEVIAILQQVRMERQGDMSGVPLVDLMKDAERILSHQKAHSNKTSSLTIRAKMVADHEEPCDNQLCPARLKLLKYRTELCLSFQTTGTCHMRPGSCVYAHGVHEQKQLPKEELCERYAEGKCSNKRCVYAHGASELRKTATVAEYLNSKKSSHVNGSTVNGHDKEHKMTLEDYPVLKK